MPVCTKEIHILVVYSWTGEMSTDFITIITIVRCILKLVSTKRIRQASESTKM